MKEQSMRSIKFITSAAALALLAACGGGGGGGGATISGGVVKGPVLGSTVCAFAITAGAKGAQVPLSAAGGAGSITGGCYVTPADGSYVFSVPSGTGDILLEATGGKFCTNETPIVANACPGGGTIVDLGAQVMSAAVAAGANATVYTTPLTTAAVGAAGAGLTAATFNASFTTLAGAVIGAGTTITPASQPTAGTQPYLTTAAQTLAGGGSMASVVSSLGGGGGTSPATVNVAVADSYALKFFISNGVGCDGISGCSFSEGMDVPVTVHADGRLSIAGKVLTNPFYRNYGSGPHLPEIIWRDPDSTLEYALSDNETGEFHEINVGDSAQPQGPLAFPKFIGQIRKPELPGIAALQGLAGTYRVASQYAGSTAVTYGTVTISSEGAIEFIGGAGPRPNLSVANRGTVTSNIVSSGSISVESTVNINDDMIVDHNDRILLYVNGAGQLKDIQYYNGSGDFAAGVTVNAVAIGTASTSSFPIPASNGTSGTYGTTTLTVSGTEITGTTPTGVRLVSAQGSGGTLNQWIIDISNVAGNVEGVTYHCNHGDRSKFIALQVGSTTFSTREGGSCNIHIVTLDADASGNPTLLEGRFFAEMYTYKRNEPRIVEGAFRFAPPP
jgi:hypothetical protein